MWIEISKDIFESSDFKALNYLYQTLSWYPSHSIARYKIFIDKECIKDTSNYEQLNGIERQFEEFIDAEFNEFINSKPKNAKRDYLVTNRKAKNNFNLEEAIRFFNQPVSIILENNKNDSCFIESIINHFDSTETLKHHLKNGWIKYENAGGCTNVTNFLKGHLNSFNVIALQNGRKVSDYFRGIIILDSDKEYATQEIKSNYTALVSQLDQLAISSFHILEKRAMENYLPDEVFVEMCRDFRQNSQRNKDLINWINVYLNLQNKEQKDFLNIKSGFSKEEDKNGDRLPIKIEISNLYNIGTASFTILDNGFKLSDFKNSYPRYFLDSPFVNKKTLRDRANSEELENILEKIKKLI